LSHTHFFLSDFALRLLDHNQIKAHEWKLDMCGYWAMQRLFIGKEGLHTEDNEPYNKEKENGVAFTGFYDPEKLYTLSRLETEGLAAMGGWEEPDINDVIQMIEKDKITNRYSKKNKGVKK